MISGDSNENGIKKQKQKQNQRHTGKKKIGLNSKTKTTLHVQHTFLYNIFGVVLHDYNVKFAKTS